MSATSEELAAQAEELQTSIAYFRLSNGAQARASRLRSCAWPRPAPPSRPPAKAAPRKLRHRAPSPSSRPGPRASPST
jgi:methyl-accepting chemotaxis protein